MKRTTYIFIAGTLLFIAAIFIYNNIEKSRAIILRQQAEKEKITTPFTLKHVRRQYDMAQLFSIIQTPYEKDYICGDHKTSSSDSVMKGTFKGEPSAFFRFNLVSPIIDKGKEIAFLNDGEAIVYDAEADSLLEASELNRRLFNFQRTTQRYDAKSPDTRELFENIEEADSNQINYLRANLHKAYPLRMEFRKQIVDFCNANEDNMLPAYILSRYANLLNSETTRALHYKQGAYWNHPLMKYFPNYQHYAKGTPFTDLDLYTLKGESVKLSQWVGKGHYTLVDMSTGIEDRDLICMHDTYARYHQTHGFEIVHIYTGKRYKNWNALVKNQKMPWVKLSALDYTYKVFDAYTKECTPSNVIMLFDPEGKMVRHNIHDVEIESLLREVYGE